MEYNFKGIKFYQDCGHWDLEGNICPIGKNPCSECEHLKLTAYGENANKITDLIGIYKKDKPKDKIIKQLEEIKDNAEYSSKHDVDNQMWLDDIEALDYAIKKLKEDKP
jgi:hypothetical protein